MRIQVRAGIEAGRALHEAAQRRLRFALGRFDRRIDGVRVRFHDVNGPRGGVDQECQVTVRLGRPAELVVVEETGCAIPTRRWPGRLTGRRGRWGG